MAAPSAHRRPASVAARARVVAVGLALFAIAVAGVVKLTVPGPAASVAGVAPSVASPSDAGATGGGGTTGGAGTTAGGGTTGAPPTTAPPSAAPPRYVFPVRSGNVAYAHTHDEYPASDILAACGTPVVAVTDGVVLEVNRVDRWDPATDDGAWRGGRFLSILGDDGVRYYGGHYSVINDGIEAGVRVAAGQPVGQIGTTGKSSACHLHFGISPPCGRTGDWWNRRGVIWPWSYLDAWRAGTSASAVPEITAWQAVHGCPTAPAAPAA